MRLKLLSRVSSRARYGARHCGVTDRSGEKKKKREQLETQPMQSPAAGDLQRNLQLGRQDAAYGPRILSGFLVLLDTVTQQYNIFTNKPAALTDEEMGTIRSNLSSLKLHQNL